MVSERETYFDADHVVSEGLWFAFGITAYDSNREEIEDPSIGVVKPAYKQWGLETDFFTEIPTRNCTESELHINGQDDPDSKFYQPHTNTVTDLTFFNKKLKCLDVDSISVQGDYNSAKARQFVLLFQKCDNSTFDGVCKPEEDILRWLQRKFIFIAHNTMRF